MNTKTTKAQHTFVKFAATDDDLADEVFIWGRVTDLAVRDGKVWGYEIEVVSCVTYTKDGYPVIPPANGTKGVINWSNIVDQTTIKLA